MIRDITATLREKKNLTGNIWWFEFVIQGEPLDFAPGQYVLLKIGTAFRQYSICSVANPQNIELLVEFIPGGLASTYLDNLRVGEIAEFKGPAGIFTLRDTPSPKVYLATGTGIAPVKAMIEHALTHGIGSEHHLYFGLKTRADMYFKDEFHALKQTHSNFSYTYCISREEDVDMSGNSECQHGRVTSVLDHDVSSGKIRVRDSECYVCGSKDIVSSVKAHCVELGADAQNVMSEMFG